MRQTKVLYKENIFLVSKLKKVTISFQIGLSPRKKSNCQIQQETGLQRDKEANAMFIVNMRPTENIEVLKSVSAGNVSFLEQFASGRTRGLERQRDFSIVQDSRQSAEAVGLS